MSRTTVSQELTQAGFAPFGDVIEAAGDPGMLINQGMCGRYHDLAKLDFAGDDARAGISIFQAQPYDLPLDLKMMERHPLGSQAFIPMTAEPFLVIVAEDDGGRPADPLAFLTRPGQGVNYHRDVWHGVLTPLKHPALFAVIDRIGEGDNLQEHWFEIPHRIVAGE